MPATRQWTLEDVDALPEDGNRYELVHGELLVTPAPGTTHEEVAMRLHELLAPYVAAHALGHVYRPRAVVQHAGDQVEPDLQVRGPLRMGESWTDAPVPILAVEVLSPSNREAHQVLKRAFYREAGVAEYWIVDPVQRCITIVRDGSADLRVSETLSWHPNRASMPFALDVQALFR